MWRECNNKYSPFWCKNNVGYEEKESDQSFSVRKVLQKWFNELFLSITLCLIKIEFFILKLTQNQDLSLYRGLDKSLIQIIVS